MASPIVSRARILSEFDRLKAQCYEFSDPELCILVAANLCIDISTVQDVVRQREQEAA